MSYLTARNLRPSQGSEDSKADAQNRRPSVSASASLHWSGAQTHRPATHDPNYKPDPVLVAVKEMGSMDLRKDLEFHQFFQKKLTQQRGWVEPALNTARTDRYYWTGDRLPVVDSITPRQGAVGGNTRVEIRGIGFGNNQAKLRVAFAPWEDTADVYGAHEVFVHGRDPLGKKKRLSAIAEAKAKGRPIPEFSDEDEDEDDPLEPEGGGIQLVSPTRMLVLTPNASVHGMHAVFVERKTKRGWERGREEAKNLFFFKGPSVTNVYPHTGSIAGGTRITVVGQGFGDGEGETVEVHFNGKPCSDVQYQVLGKRLTAVVPPSVQFGFATIEVILRTAHGVAVRSHNTDTSNNLFEYIQGPPETERVGGRRIKVRYVRNGYKVDLIDLFRKDETPDDTLTVLRRNLEILDRVFWYYALCVGTAGEDDPTNMSNRQFRLFCEDAKLFGEEQQGIKLPLADMDNVFIRVNREVDGDDLSNSNTSLVYTEFMAAIVRIAVKKYPDTPKISQRLSNCLMDFVFTNCRKLENQQDIILMLANRKVVKNLFSKDSDYAADLQAMFLKYAQGDSDGRLMDIKEFMTLMVDKKIVKPGQSEEDRPDDRPSIPELRKMFFLSNLGRWVYKNPEDPCQCLGICRCEAPENAIQLILPVTATPRGKTLKVYQPTKGADDFDQLGFEEFLEAIGRLAIKMKIPKNEREAAQAIPEFLSEFLPTRPTSSGLMSFSRPSSSGFQ